MRKLKIDNCQYCCCSTFVIIDDNEQIQDMIDNGEDCFVCSNCYESDGEYHTEFDVFEKDKKIWCGHKKMCADVIKLEGNQC